MKRKDEANDFEHAEQALALLEGRDPEVVRKARKLRQQDSEYAARRQQETELAQRRHWKSVVVRTVLSVGAIAAATGAFWFWRTSQHRNDQIDKLIASQDAPLLAAGFQRKYSAGPLRGAVSVSARMTGCVAALAVEGNNLSTVELRIEGKSKKNAGAVAVCGCSPMDVRASAQGVNGPAAVGLYQAPISEVGGSGRLGKVLPGVPRLELEEPCAEISLDSWLAAHGQPVAQEAIKNAPGATAEILRRRGLRVTGFSPADGEAVIPFSIGGEDCGLVLAKRPALRGREGSLWQQGEEAGIAFCGAGTSVNAVVRGAPEPVLVAVTSAAQLGGVLPLVDAARAAGAHGKISTVLTPTTINNAARRLLERVLDTAASIRSATAAPEARVLSIARAQTTQALAISPLLCDPPLEAGVPQTLCILPPGKPLPELTSDLAAFSAPLPVWLRIFERAVDPVAHERLLGLLSLTRYLRGEGFEPVYLESVRESPGAVEVTGRAGEDRVVVVGLSPKPPYAVPLGDGPKWKLGQEPRIVPLKPGERKTFRDPSLLATPIKDRRTIVFRAGSRLISISEKSDPHLHGVGARWSFLW